MKYWTLILLLLLVSCTPTNSDTTSLDELTEDDIEQITQEFSDEIDRSLFALLDTIRNPSVNALAEAQEIVRDLGQTNDERVVAPLIELLRFTDGPLQAEIVTSLQSVTGEHFTSWPEWLTYLGNKGEIALPESYLAWKGERLALIDPNFEMFFEGNPSQADFFRPELAVWGGVRVAIEPGVDIGIPPLEEPAVIAGSDAEYLRDEDTVFGIVVDGQARAYPQRIIDWHEMVNDEINGQHFSIAYCTLCGAAIAYDTEVGDGTHRTFSSSGLLYESNKVMFDRQTNTLWNHILGKPVLGELVGEVDELPLLFIEYTTWADWLAQHPDTEVLDIDTGFARDYSEGVPSYNRYFASPDTLFPTSTVPGPFLPKQRVFGIVEDEGVKAYGRDAVWESGVVNDEFNGRGVVVLTTGDAFGIRAYERGDTEFSLTDDRLVDEAGIEWEITDTALVQESARLERIASHEAFWFGWIINYPDTEVYPEN